MAEIPATVSLSVPAEIAPFLLAIVDHVAAFRESTRGGDPDFGVAELRAYELFAEAERASIGSMLAALDPVEDRVQVYGRAWQRLNLVTGDDYFTMRGPVRVQRGLYREEGVHNGPTIVPLELRAGIVEGRLTPAAGKGTAALAQAMPSREAEGVCRALGVLPYSRSEHLRVGDGLGGRWEKLRAEHEPVLLVGMKIPEQAASLSIAVDRASVPMAEPRPLTRADVAKGVKDPYSVNLRMAFAAVVTLYDAKGKPLTCIRHAHVPDGGAQAVQAALTADVDGILARRPDLKLVLLSDGAPEMESIVDAAAGNHPVAGRNTDFWHFIEKLGAAIGATGRYVSDQLGDWATDLLARDDAVESIEQVLRTWVLAYVPDVLPKPLHEALTYIENRRDRLRYATSHAAGLPIGSGTVEATCKTIVDTRMRRPGASWEVPGAQAILGIRALWTSSSERWNAALDHTLASYRAQVTPLPSKPRRASKPRRSAQPAP